MHTNSIIKIRKYLRENQELLKTKNLRFISVGKKLIGNITTNHNSLIFAVSKKQKVPQKYKIPPLLKYDKDHLIRTDVIEIKEKIIAFGLQSGYLILNHDNEMGAVFMSTLTDDGSGYILTNSHVISDVDKPLERKEVYAKSINTDSWTRIGQSKYATPLKSNTINKMDAGLVELYEGINIRSRGVIGEDNLINEYDYFRTETSTKYFATDGTQTITLGNPKRVETPALIEVDGIGVLFQNCWRLDLLAGRLDKGHSGSLIYRRKEQGILAVGILFAGIPGKEAWAFPAKAAVNAVRNHIE